MRNRRSTYPVWSGRVEVPDVRIAVITQEMWDVDTSVFILAEMARNNISDRLDFKLSFPVGGIPSDTPCTPLPPSLLFLESI